jgi:hypothetical protein
VRQGLPRLKLENLGSWVERCESGRGLFGFAAGCDHYQLKRGEFLRGAKIADCLDDAGLCANWSHHVGASICDFRLQCGEWVTLGDERLKSFERDPFSFCRFFERDKACEGLRVCRAHEGKSTLAKLVLPLKAKEQSCHSEQQSQHFGQSTQLSLGAHVEASFGSLSFSCFWFSLRS